MSDKEDLFAIVNGPTPKPTHHDDSRPDSISELMIHISKKINFKMVFLIFVIFVFLNTTTFITSILDKISGASSGGVPTEKGILLQGGFLSMMYIILSILMEAGLL